MTKFEFFDYYLNGFTTDRNGNVLPVKEEDMKAYAEAQIAKINENREKAKLKRAEGSSKPSKAEEANKPVRDLIYESYMSDELLSAPKLATALNISTSKASTLLRGLVKEGRAVAEDFKEGKRTLKGYRKAVDGEVVSNY